MAAAQSLPPLGSRRGSRQPAQEAKPGVQAGLVLLLVAKPRVQAGLVLLLRPMEGVGRTKQVLVAKEGSWAWPGEH